MVSTAFSSLEVVFPCFSQWICLPPKNHYKMTVLFSIKKFLEQENEDQYIIIPLKLRAVLSKWYKILEIGNTMDYFLCSPLVARNFMWNSENFQKRCDRPRAEHAESARVNESAAEREPRERVSRPLHSAEKFCGFWRPQCWLFCPKQKGRNWKHVQVGCHESFPSAADVSGIKSSPLLRGVASSELEAAQAPLSAGNPNASCGGAGGPSGCDALWRARRESRSLPRCRDVPCPPCLLHLTRRPWREGQWSHLLNYTQTPWRGRAMCLKQMGPNCQHEVEFAFSVLSFSLLPRAFRDRGCRKHNHLTRHLGNKPPSWAGESRANTYSVNPKGTPRPKATGIPPQSPMAQSFPPGGASLGCTGIVCVNPW